MSKKEKFIQCKFGKKDCFGEWEGLCIPLAGMPKSNECPFYKTFEQADIATHQLIKEAIDRMNAT